MAATTKLPRLETDCNGAWRAPAPKVSRAAQHASQVLGVRPKTAAHWISGRQAIAERCAIIARSYRALGDERGLERFLAPIRAAEADAQPTTLTSAHYLALQISYMHYAQTEVAYRRTPSPAGAQALLRVLDELSVAAQRLRLSLKQRHELGGA